jgi:hypothetical protein
VRERSLTPSPEAAVRASPIPIVCVADYNVSHNILDADGVAPHRASSTEVAAKALRL